MKQDATKSEVRRNPTKQYAAKNLGRLVDQRGSVRILATTENRSEIIRVEIAKAGAVNPVLVVGDAEMERTIAGAKTMTLF